MNLDYVLLSAYILAEASVVSLLGYRRVWKILPIFSIYCVWDIAVNLIVFWVQRNLPDAYLSVYLTETALDSALQFSVLVELAWSVLRPIRASLPRKTILLIIGGILVLGAVIWPFLAVHQNMAPGGLFLMHLLQTVSILRILFFVSLAGFSQLLSLSWRDRELQIVTGLGIYSTFSLAVTMYHTHQTGTEQNVLLNQIVIASYICSLVYWVICFSQQEQERKEFTPQMQNLLLAMAGVARADREALAKRSVTNASDKPVVWPPK